MDTVLFTLTLSTYETLKGLSSLPIFMQNHSGEDSTELGIVTPPPPPPPPPPPRDLGPRQCPFGYNSAVTQVQPSGPQKCCTELLASFLCCHGLQNAVRRPVYSSCVRLPCLSQYVLLLLFFSFSFLGGGRLLRG